MTRYCILIHYNISKRRETFPSGNEPANGFDETAAEGGKCAEFSFRQLLHKENEGKKSDAPRNRQPVIPSCIPFKINKIVFDLQRHPLRRDDAAARRGNMMPEFCGGNIDHAEAGAQRTCAHIGIFRVKWIEHRIEHAATVQHFFAETERTS